MREWSGRGVESFVYEGKDTTAMLLLLRLQGGVAHPFQAIGQLLATQISLRTKRRLQAATRSSRPSAIKPLEDFDFSC